MGKLEFSRIGKWCFEWVGGEVGGCMKTEYFYNKYNDILFRQSDEKRHLYVRDGRRGNEIDR